MGEIYRPLDLLTLRSSQYPLSALVSIAVTEQQRSSKLASDRQIKSNFKVKRVFERMPVARSVG